MRVQPVTSLLIHPIQKRRTERRAEKVDSGKVTEDEAIFKRCTRATTDVNARSATAGRIAVLAACYPPDRRVAAYQSLPMPVHRLYTSKT